MKINYEYLWFLPSSWYFDKIVDNTGTPIGRFLSLALFIPCMVLTVFWTVLSTPIMFVLYIIYGVEEDEYY